jgi:hypothetical protein
VAIASGPVDSSGVVHGCYAPTAHKGSHTLTLQNADTACPKGTTAVSWNQKGPQGAAGPAGAGLTFTTASGATGPTITTAGIDATSPATFFCNVAAVLPTGGGTAVTSTQWRVAPVQTTG